MKNKYKLKKKPKYATGVQEVVNPYQQSAFERSEVTPTDITGSGNMTGIADKTATGITSAFGPVAGAFMGVGKLGRSVSRQDDEYGVAKSNAGAGIGSTFAPHKQIVRELENGKLWRGVEAAFNPFGAAARQNKEDKATRDQYIQAQKVEENKKQFAGVDYTLAQSNQVYKTGNKAVKDRKAIEAEGGELVFSKVGNKYKLSIQIFPN